MRIVEQHVQVVGSVCAKDFQFDVFQLHFATILLGLPSQSLF